MTDGVSDQAQAPPLMVHISERPHFPPSCSLSSLTSSLSLLRYLQHSERPLLCSQNAVSRQAFLCHLPPLCWHVSVLWVYHTSNHLLCSSLHLKFPLVLLGRCRFLLTSPSCSLCLFNFTVRFCLHVSVGLPHLFISLPLPLLLCTCDSLAAVFDVLENRLALHLCASRMTIPVETIGK